MRRLAAGWRPVVPPAQEEAARDCLARAQSALLDEHVGGALRQLLGLYDLLVPPIDRWVHSQAVAAGEPAAQSVATGIFGLWDELCDIDVERESLESLLVYHAAQAPLCAKSAGWLALVDGDDEAQAARRSELEALLLARIAELGPPQPSWWRRLARRAAGSLEDRGHFTVQRGAEVVRERPPPPEPVHSDGDTADEWTSDLGPLQAGDRLILRWTLPLPGQVAVLHAVADAPEVALSLLLPERESEAVVRRAGEQLEVVGEVSAVADAAEHSLIIVWVPELLPPSWAGESLARRRVPPEARLYRYRYTVGAAG